MTEHPDFHSDAFSPNHDTFWYSLFLNAPHAMALASKDGCWLRINLKAQLLLPPALAFKGHAIRASLIAEDQPLWDQFWSMINYEAAPRHIDLHMAHDLPDTKTQQRECIRIHVDACGSDTQLLTLTTCPVADEHLHRACKEELSAICDHIPALVAFVDQNQRYQFCNTTYTTWFGLDKDQLIGHHLNTVLDELAYARAEPHIKKALKGHTAQFENEILTLSGYRYVATKYVPHHTKDHVDGFHVFVFDISEHKALEDQLSFEATHDPLTSLPNKRALTTLLRHALARRSRSDRGMALIYLDLDHFANLNLEHGQEFGDMVLQHVARTLIEQVRQTDIVARWDGDEFIVVLEGLEEPESDALSIAGKILTALQNTSKVNRKPVHLAGCIGISTVKAEQSVTLEELISAADHAMHQAKSQGRNQTILHPLTDRPY